PSARTASGNVAPSLGGRAQAARIHGPLPSYRPASRRRTAHDAWPAPAPGGRLPGITAHAHRPDFLSVHRHRSPPQARNTERHPTHLIPTLLRESSVQKRPSNGTGLQRRIENRQTHRFVPDPVPAPAPAHRLLHHRPPPSAEK